MSSECLICDTLSRYNCAGSYTISEAEKITEGKRLKELQYRCSCWYTQRVSRVQSG